MVYFISWSRPSEPCMTSPTCKRFQNRLIYSLSLSDHYVLSKQSRSNSTTTGSLELALKFAVVNSSVTNQCKGLARVNTFCGVHTVLEQRDTKFDMYGSASLLCREQQQRSALLSMSISLMSWEELHRWQYVLTYFPRDALHSRPHCQNGTSWRRRIRTSVSQSRATISPMASTIAS